MFLQHGSSELHTNCKADIQDSELSFQIQSNILVLTELCTEFVADLFIT